MLSIREFYKSMVSDGSEVSSKRVVGFWTFILFWVEVLFHLITGVVLQSELIYLTGTIILGCFGLNTILDAKAFGKNLVKDNIFLKKKPSDKPAVTPASKPAAPPAPTIAPEVKPEVKPVAQKERRIKDDLNGTKNIPPQKGKVHILTQEELTKKYGKPCDSANHVKVDLPFPLIYDGKEVNSLIFHKKAAAAIMNVFNDILAHYGHDKIKELGIDIYGGTFNCRPMRGGTNWSTHAWALAIDLDPDRNKLHESKKTARFARPEYKAMIDIFYRYGFISLGRERDFDWMHFQYNV